MCVVTRSVLSLVLLVALTARPAAGQAACALSPIFGLFREAVGGDVIGDCTEAAVVAENGDIVQATTGGFALFQHTDQVIAFTDGQTMWIFGPEGLQQRGVSEPFAWEQQPAQAVAPPVAPSVPPAAPDAAAPRPGKS
jgi:hypothetical protein